MAAPLNGPFVKQYFLHYLAGSGGYSILPNLMTLAKKFTVNCVNPMRVHRVEVRPRPGQIDPAAAALMEQAQAYCGPITALEAATIYLIEAPLYGTTIQRIADELLADPVSQTSHIGAAQQPDQGVTVEVHYKPGVMDPVAQSTAEAIAQMVSQLDPDRLAVRTGRRYDLVGPRVTRQSARQFARTALANPVIQDIHDVPQYPEAFVHGRPYQLQISRVSICALDDHVLKELSRNAHLFLSLDEMRTIRDYYVHSKREPTDIELETIAQTWSEHCVHKTLRATIHYTAAGSESLIPGLTLEQISRRPGHTLNSDGSVTINNLLKSTIAAATHHLMEDAALKAWCVSVFADNAGIIRFDDDDGIAVKVETHNHPSAIEPYGGAATGIGGCIRDIMGTGLSARPIASTDTFAVALPDTAQLPKGVIHPRRILQQVVAGVRDYGNRMGIATVNGSVYFDDAYLGNPLVFVGCVGLIPLQHAFGKARAGDRIIALGGRTGHDGIHGATFSSSELTDTHGDEFSHAVQIGNPITQKKMMDVILQARDIAGGPLFSAITDCGAGGFSSAVGEMGQHVGARVTLDTAPLKYQGLSYTEIWISEAQERMVLAVPAQHVQQLARLCEAEDVEWCDLGCFGLAEDGHPQLLLTYEDVEVGRLAMAFLHEGLPTPTRRATWGPPAITPKPSVAGQVSVTYTLLKLLAHPNIASKHWIVRQYDHEVQGASVVKPLVGPQQDGPGDAAVIRPKPTSDRGIAIGAGMQPGIGEKAAPYFARQGDAYWMALASIDEAVRNVVCVGCDPMRIALLDNFCWPGCDDPNHLGSLVRAAEACFDGALAYCTPFISGKDSLNNQFTTDDGRLITIPPTLLITAVGIVPNVMRCVTMDAKASGNLLVLVGKTKSPLGGSHYVRITGDMSGDLSIPKVDLQHDPKTARSVAQLIAQRLIRSAHDCSDGGLLVAAAEMAFTGRLGLELDLSAPGSATALNAPALYFAETPGRYLLEVESNKLAQVTELLQSNNTHHRVIGTFTDDNHLTIADTMKIALDDLYQAWRSPLDW